MHDGVWREGSYSSKYSQSRHCVEVSCQIQAFAVLRLTKRLCYESASRILGFQDGLEYSGEQTGLLGQSNHDSWVVQPVTQSLRLLSIFVKI